MRITGKNLLRICVALAVCVALSLFARVVIDYFTALYPNHPKLVEKSIIVMWVFPMVYWVLVPIARAMGFKVH
jgi:hypothetical protein